MMRFGSCCSPSIVFNNTHPVNEIIQGEIRVWHPPFRVDVGGCPLFRIDVPVGYTLSEARPLPSSGKCVLNRVKSDSTVLPR
jgi:hypothetical protein